MERACAGVNRNAETRDLEGIHAIGSCGFAVSRVPLGEEPSKHTGKDIPTATDGKCRFGDRATPVPLAITHDRARALEDDHHRSTTTIDRPSKASGRFRTGGFVDGIALEPDRPGKRVPFPGVGREDEWTSNTRDALASHAVELIGVKDARHGVQLGCSASEMIHAVPGPKARSHHHRMWPGLVDDVRKLRVDPGGQRPGLITPKRKAGGLGHDRKRRGEQPLGHGQHRQSTSRSERSKRRQTRATEHVVVGRAASDDERRSKGALVSIIRPLGQGRQVFDASQGTH